jgi:N12 class adenine-specific DNA methylase
MDLNPFARSPLSLSKSFYDDITKDTPFPVSKDFYDAISKPVEEKPTFAAPVRYEMASPGEIADTVGAIGEAAYRTPLQIAGATASAIRGGSREAVADKDSFLTRIINRANQDSEDFQKKYADNKVVILPLTKLGLPADIDTQTITRFPQQEGFSGASMVASVAAGLGTAAAGPIVSGAAVAAAGGVAGYRMQKDMSAQQLYQSLNETSMKTVGRELSPEEWKTAYDKNEGLLVEQGISEAIPEAVGNFAGFELFFGAAKNIFGKQLAKTVIGKALDKYGAGAVGKLLADQATEQSTEIVSQQWQHNLDLEMGLSPGDTKRSWTNFNDLAQSFKEVFPDILLLTAVSGGAGLVGGHIQDKMAAKKSAQLVKDVVAENKFDSIPNEFLPAMYEHAQDLSDQRPKDKSLATARDAFATEMDKRGIDFDMTSKFKEYLKLDAALKSEDATGGDVARWVSLRDEFKEKNISPDLYQGYLAYQADINKAFGLTKLIAEGKATEPQRKEFNRLADAIASKATMFGFPEEVLDSTGVEKGGVVRKPLGPAKGAARDILLADEPAAKRKNLTAKDILTEGDVNIQTEEDLTPEALAGIDKKLEIAGTGGARGPKNVAEETPGKTLDITEVAKAEDKKKFDLWDTQETGTPAFVRMKVEKLFAEGGAAAVLDEYRGEDTVSAYARYRLGMLEKPAPGEKAPVETGQEQDLVKKIASGGVNDFTFPEHYSPMDLSTLWDDLYVHSEDVTAKNKPTIDALAQERDALKSDRSKESLARKKQIDEEIGNLRAESQIVIRNADIAWQYAQEDLAQKVVAKLKEEGIEADQDSVYDAIATLADGRMNEQGWQQPLLQQVIDSLKGGQGPAPKSAREESDEIVKRYRDAGHNINDNGVYNEPEEIAIPFSKSSGREGSIRIAKGPDEKFRIGVNISKKYGDYEGSGNAPGIDGKPYDTRAEAIKAGIDIIRSRTKDDDPKGKAALAELAKFEKEQSTEIKAAGTNRPKSPVGQAKEETVPVEQALADNPDLQEEAITQSYTERMKNAASADEGRKLISQYEEEFASIEREAGLEHSIGKGGGGLGSRGYSTLRPAEKIDILKRVTEKDKALGQKLKSLIADIDAAEPYLKNLLKGEQEERHPGLSQQPAEIKAAGTGGKRGPKEEKESATPDRQREQDEISGRLTAQNARETEFEYQKKRTRLLSNSDKAAAVEGFSLEDAKRFLSDLNAAPGDDPKARQAILEKYPQLSNPETAKADIQKEIAEISDEDLDALLDVPEKKEAAPIIFQIDDMVRPKAGSGISQKNAGRVLHIFTAANGVQSIRTEGSGKIHFFAKHFELASKEATPSDEAVKRRSEQLTELSKDLTPFSKTMPAKPTPSEMGVRKESPTMRQATLMGRTVWTNGSYIENSELDPYPKMQGRTLETGGLANGNIIWNQAKDYDVIVEGPLALLTRDRETIEKEIYLFDLGADHPLFVAKRLYDHFYMRYGNLILKWSGDSKDKLPMLSVYDGDEMVGAMMPVRDNAIESVKVIKEALALKGGKRPLLEGRGSILPSAKPAKALDDILADVAKEGVEGAGEALKGLYELFGGASLKSFPGGFDEDTYLKAKPHFEAALEHFIKVGKGLREFAASIVQQFGDAIRPYLKQFIKDRRDGVTEEKAEEEGEVINLDENTGKGEGGARTRRKLTDQEKAEKEAAKKRAEEKKEKKAAMGEFKNVGYVYDPEKLNQKIKDKPPKSAAKIILDEMVPGKLWAIDFPEGATPGVVRVKDQIQKHFLTFKEYLTENRDRLRYMSGKTIDDKIEHWLNFREGSIDKLKEWASEYGKTMQPVIDAFNGQASIINVIGRLQDTVVGARKEDGTFPDYSEASTRLSGLLSTRDYVQRPNTLYTFLTDTWQRLLEDENDILLSEIDINKRGRNKKVVRSGLPDYREGVELKKTEDFQAPFGFKGVGFGEEGWINQEERNRVIPAAFDSFKDLAATIGAPDNGMSLGGELAVQFANLGHKAKGAAAAYFPTVQTINFTRDNGDGTMAHEWGHGLHDLASEDAKSEINSVIGTFHYVYDFDAGTRLVDDLLATDSMFLKRMVSSKKQQRIEAVKNEVTNRFEDTVRKSTDYYSTAQQMDEDYTARAQEMWARAFEAYIYDTLQGKNNYLVNDFVAAGRVGGKSGVGTKLVYPAGKERETFNETIKHLLDGLVWDESGKPSLKADYVTIEKAHELMLQLQLRYLLDQVEARYTAIWASEPSKDGYYWYRYDDTSFGPMMQPDGYAGHDKGYTSEGQNGTGAVAYLTQLHPDDILDYKLSNIQYEGENPVYIAKERGGIDVGLQEDGTEALEEVPARPDSSPDEGGDVRSGDRGSGGSGLPGTREPGKQRGADGSVEGDSTEGVHPSPAGNYRITDLTLNDPKSVPVRFGLNLSAVKVLNLVESENRTPTDAEKDILAQYSGWGGMSELFAYEPTAAWAGKAELLKAELTEDELRDAASSSTSAYYTPVPVGTFMWKLAQRLGFTNGVVLDPATGANGLFLGTMPSDLAQGTALQGIEMDGVSARIATQLYGLASIETKSFQDVKKPNNRFDLTITNVPFENFSPSDLKHNKGGYRLHNYFINKMLNLTAPGALSMMITTSNTLDAVGAHLAEFAGKAQLVGAIRLPSGIYSSTQVATDILVFRKNIEGGKFVGVPAEEWTTAGTDESTGLTINNYFLKHPEMVAGKLEKITGRYGNEGLRVAPEGDLQSNLERLAAAFPDKIVEREAVKEAKSIDDIISAPGTIKEGGAYINDKGEVCVKEDSEELKLPVATASEQKKAEVVRLYVRVLDQIRTLLRAQKTETDAKVIKEEQVKLKKWYDLFVKKFGPVNDPKNRGVYVDYTDSAWVLALEEHDPDTNKVTKLADIFTKNITAFAARPDRADTDHDALAMALDEFGYPNLEYMARLRSSDVESVRAGVADKIVENPETGFLETIDEYLSGNVKRKLAVAREMAASNTEYARNVALLEAAQPAEIPQHRITARIGASWIDPAHLAEFVRDKMALRHGLHAIFNFSPVSNEWSMSFGGEEHYRGRGKGVGENKAEVQRQIAAAKRSVEATTVWGTQRMDFFELMKCALMGKRPQVTFTVDRKQYLDEVATQAAEVKLQDIQSEFGRWLFAEAGRSDEAVKRFNDLINTSVPMNADGSHLTFPGKGMWMVTPKEKAALGITDALTFYPHQMNAAWKYLKNGNLYLGHEVGTGKTVTMALIAMEAKRLRGKKKVLYVTLNDSTMGQAVQEIKNLYPMANILPVRVSTNEQRKQRSLQKIALNDFDIAIMRQQDLDRIGLSPESERVFIEEELLELREILEEAKKEGARILEQDIQVQIHALEEKLKAPGVHDEAKRKNLFFDDLGIDLMIVDEAHKYKNIPYATRLTRITGLNPTGSPTAKDFFRKTQYLNAQFPKKDGIVLASGTALSNSIAEMYNIQRMLQPQEVKRQGVWSFDRWIANFGDMGSQLEWDGARGQYKVITTNRRIVNAGRLLATAYQNVDSVRAKDTPVKRPIIRGGEPQRVKVQPNQYVEDYKQIVLERCAAIEADPKNAEYEGVPDNMLRIISNMSKVAIDQRLDHHYANTEMQQDSKIATASKIMYRRWQEEAKHKGVQLVFADLGIPGKYSDKFKYKTEDETSQLAPEDLAIYNEEMFEHESASAGFNTYEGLKKELVKLGIPENQIAFIHDADHSNKEKKAANLRSLFKKVNAGDIRVLIGSTSKAGTGVNIQGRVSDIHHLDVWWNYSAWEQRNGRGIRAGNLYANEGMPGTYIWNYVTETTVDATRWDKVFAKGKVLNAVLGGDVNLDVIEDISDETMSAKMMAAEASGDPLMSTQATLLQKVQGLRFEQAAHLDVVRRSKMDLAAIPDRIEALEKGIKDYQRSRDIMDKVTAVRFIGDDRTLVLEKHGKEIAEALENAVKADTGSWTENKKVTLLVFGSHTETEVTEEVEGKDGEKKEKKVKKYTFVPLPAKADITGKERDPYGRRLLISGSILSSDRNLADIQAKQGKDGIVTTVDIKANVSRTVTEYLSYLNHSEESAKGAIAELKSNAPKLQSVIDTPWAKVDELAKNDKELREVEAQMASRGVSVGDPTTGIPIDKYKGIVPVLEDVADKDGWSFHDGIVYPHQNTTIGVRGKQDLSRFLKSGKLKPHIASQYNAPDSLQALNGGKPGTPATEPVAYTVIDNVTKFWVPAGGTFVTVDPVEWNLLKRILGEEGTWHYAVSVVGRYLVHVNEAGERDAFIHAEQERYVPQGVKDIDEKSTTTGHVQYSVGKEAGTGRGKMDLGTVQSLFPGQQVEQDGENFTVTLKNGAQAIIYGVAEITPNAVSLNAGYKKGLGVGRFIAGAFDGLDAQGRGVIRIIRDNAKAPWTISHESVHWLEKVGVISESDKATLNARIQKEGKWNKDLSHEENRANWLADFVRGPKPNQTVLAQIWQKIQDFINRVVGIRTAGMIGRELQSGKIFEREIQDASLGGEAYGTGKYDNFGDTAVTDFSEDEAWHDIAYREPTKKAIARLNAWLKENQYATIRMYHGTDASIPVMKEGLKPTSARTAKSLQSSHGTVSLSLFPGMAHQFGRLAYAGKEIAIYPVDVLVKNLVPDNDQLRNKRHFGGRTNLGDTLAESIAIGHGAKVRGAVPVDWIRTGEEKPSVKAYDEALFAHAYISPRVKPSLSAQEKTIRENAYGVKGMDPVVLDSVAKEMAALIPKEARKSAILIPIPGHTGETAANVALAERIAAITGSRVADVLKRQAGQSQRDARVAGRRTMKPVEFGMISTETLDGDNVFFVDNVISSGATIRAARDAVGGGKGLVYAKSNPKGEKYTIGTVDPELPKWLGDKIKQAFKKDAVASILLDSGPIQSGPLDGGCRVLARALKRIEPSGKIITIEGQLKDGTWQAEHYGFELDGGMIDGDGYAASREAWAKRFANNESLDRPYRITEGEVQSEDVPQDAPTEKKLAAALEQELALDETYREPRAEKGISVYEHLPVFAITEKGLTRKPRRALNNNQEVSNGQKVSGTAVVRADNAPAAGQGTDDKRKIPAPGGRVLPYVPERGTLPTVKSEPIGTWKSSRRKITSLEDAAVIARDNLFRDAQEVFVTILTDKSGKILAVNQHATGAPNQSQVYAYFAAGQILNIEGASKVWTVHNHPSGQAKLSEADLSVSSNIGDLIADAGIESMPIIAITPTRYSDNTWSSEPLPPREPAIHELPLLGRKFDQSPEGLESIGSQNEFEEFGRTYMKEGGMVLVSAQRQPVALIAIDDYSKLRPLHTEILREAEKRNAVDFMIYNAEKTLTKADIDNLLSFAKNTQLEFTTVRDMAGDHYEKIKELWGAVRNSKERKVFYSVAKKETDAIDNASIFPEVNERLKAAKGIQYASLKNRAKDALVTGWEHFTRHFQHLEPETDGAVIDVFRKFQDVPAWAKDETVRQLSGFIGRLSPQGRDVFTMNILLPDMIRDIENGTLTVDDKDRLPFGYKNRDQVQQDYDHFKAIAEGSTAIMEALDRRNTFMASLTDQLIQHKLLKEEVANDPAAYFHHQVLAYMNYKENPNWGMSSQDVRTHRKGWQVGRKGSQLDYNTEYVESEFEIISQALTQIETVKSLKEIERLADIKPELEAEAKDKNMATFRRKAFTNPLDDPLLPYRTKIAIGFQRLAKLFTTENDMHALPMEFDDVIEHIVAQEEQRRAAKEDEIEFDPVPHPRMFALLNYLINHEGPGSMPAAMIFKAIAARNAFIKQVVGKDWVTYRDLIPEGYVAHKPETGSTFYFTNSIADQALTQVLAGHKNLPDAVRQVLARGRDEEWVVKEGISKTLNEFRPAMSDSLPAKMSKNMLTTWKQWILMNPFRVIKYNINNMSGDLDIAMAYDPKIITGYFPQAFKDLWAASKGKASEALMDELSDLTKRGVVGSGMTAMDIPELGDVKSVKGLVDFFDGKSKGALTKWWTMSKKLSTLRENILRLAANRYFLDRLGRGEIIYGASRKEEVDAIANREDKAAKLARELIGDYGNISHAGQYIRERMIPFYSWLEINAPRYVRLFRNLKDEGGGSIGAMGGVLAWKTAKLAVKASALMGLVMLWNAAFFPDEEDELQETGREQLHMILGRRADGSIITIRFQGALSDALSWFGMGNPVEQAKKVVSGTKGVGDVAKDVVSAAPLKLFQGFRPEPKLLYETLSGQSFFPDPLHPRPIRDTAEHILRTFSLDRIYNQASGKPKQGGTWATQMYRDIQSLALNEADPGEQAYYTSRKYIFDWLDKQGKEKPVAMPTNRSNSLYYYKQALKFGDFDAAEKYLKKYKDMGGKLHDVQGSIRRVHPLASLRLADRYKFKASLSPEQQETLSVATAWYKKHYVDTYREQRMGMAS